MKFKNIIFDLDGVLINSRSNMNLSWTNTAKKFDLKINFKQYEKYIGLPFKKILTKLGIKKNFLGIEKTYSQQSIINLFKGLTDTNGKRGEHNLVLFLSLCFSPRLQLFCRSFRRLHRRRRRSPLQPQTAGCVAPAATECSLASPPSYTHG